VAQFSAKFSIRFTLLQFVGVVMLVWFVLGEPLTHVANLFYGSGPAPWEEIDLVYLPDKRSPSVNEITSDLGSLAECRTWARHMAVQQDDLRMERGSYECRTVSASLFGSKRSYRLSLQ
jgi:hypothetical protein